MPDTPEDNFETATEDEVHGVPETTDEDTKEVISAQQEEKPLDSVSLENKVTKPRKTILLEGKIDLNHAARTSDGSKKATSTPVDDTVHKERTSTTASLVGEGGPAMSPVAVQPVFPPPWPEWSDEFINEEETWDVDSGIDYFEDVFAATDFLNMKAYHWMRPREFFQEPPSVVKLSSSVINIITPNAHLCEKSEIIRYILGEISELYDYSIQNKFVECEGEGTSYVPNYAEEDRKWTPWSHICCKAGVRGERPIYNPKGKYYVRLYFFGAWRRILVDDRIPVLPSGQSGLPLTELNELWPLLLTKALLKVATVTWKGEDVKKFSAISALTGWIFEWIDNIDGVNENDLWSDLQNTLPKYLDPKRIPSCYTLLHPAHKKQVFGSMEATDTFWWMPSIVVHPSETEDAVLKKIAEDEPFELETRDILRSRVYTRLSGEGEFGNMMKPLTLMEVKWQRKTVKEDPNSRHSQHGEDFTLDQSDLSKITVGGKEENSHQDVVEDKYGEVPSNTNFETMTLTKKKKKKGGIGAAFDDSKSEKKSVAAKKLAKKHKDAEGGAKTKQEGKGPKTVIVDLEAQVHDIPPVPDEDDMPDSEKIEGKKMLKLKNHKHWSTLKDIVLGDATAHADVRKSKSARKSFIHRQESGLLEGRLSKHESLHHHHLKHRIKRSEIHSEDEDHLPETTVHTMEQKKELSLPSVAEILYGVEKYAGMDYRNIVKNWENICGKDSPIALTVILKNFPPSEEEETFEGEETNMVVPAFLQHPIQLTEVRDTALQKVTNRPTTPLWKRFRWKKWAMKKGLIPLEEDHSTEVIRAIKAKTPFAFKRDWYDFTQDAVEYPVEEEEEEVRGEDDDDDAYVDGKFFFSFSTERKNKSKEMEQPPQIGLLPNKKSLSPPPGGGVGRNSLPGTDPPITPSPLGISSAQRKSKDDSAGKLSTAKPPRDTLTTVAAEPKNKSSRRRSSVKSKTPLVTGEIKPSARKSAPSSRGSAGGKRGGRTEGGVEGRGSNATMVLHETDVLMGESEEEYDENFKRKMLLARAKVFPTMAAASLWFSCDDIAKNLQKFCKFYPSLSIFGSCYILRREPTGSSNKLSPLFWDLHPEPGFPEYPLALTGYRQKEEGLNVSVKFDRHVTYHVTDYLLDRREGIDSAFYLYSDCWTEQELVITVHILQEDYLKQYNDATTSPLTEEMPGPPPTAMSSSTQSNANNRNQSPPKSIDLPLIMIMESWDWRQDSTITTPLLICQRINDRWISHFNLPAGRNTFRFWFLYQDESNIKRGGNSRGIRFLKNLMDPEEETKGRQEFERRKAALPFSVRIVSQTPIHVGSRTQVQNYMTNPPMLLLKQSERLAHCMWGLFACFGKQRSVYQQNLRQLRRTYCPTYSQPNLINKYVRGAHDTFEDLFVSLVAQFNDSKLDNMLVLTLRVLFLNPMIGRQYGPSVSKNEDTRAILNFLRGLGKKARSMLTSAVMVIQRFYRGWRVRRLFQLRRRSHRDFNRIEYNVRRIAFMLAKETDSLFSQQEATVKSEGAVNENQPEEIVLIQDTVTVDPEKVPPTMLPSPPHWSVALLKYVLERHPWLITIHPYAQCEPHHVKVQEVVGTLPQRIKDFSWYPFFREVLKVTPDMKSCFLELDLQVYPPLGVHMKIINNDNGHFLKTVNNRLFTGRLFENKYGYTIFCYRWATSTLNQEINDRPPSTVWRLRLVTPHDQDGPRFQNKEEYLSQVMSGESFGDVQIENTQDETVSRKSTVNGIIGGEVNRKSMLPSSEMMPKPDAEEFPMKLCLRRLTGYYTPNKDYSVCQYLLETDDKRMTVSLRFLASNVNVRLRVLIWDCFRKTTIFEETCTGGLIAPNIQLHVAKERQKKISDESLRKGSPMSLAGEISSEEEEEKIRNPMSAESEETSEINGVIHPDNASPKVSFGNSDGKEEDEHTEILHKESQDKIGKNHSEESVVVEEPKKRRVINKRRYIISVYVVHDTWPLTDRELLYVLYRERKFFKSIKIQHCKEMFKAREVEAKLKKEEEIAAQLAAAAVAAEFAEAEGQVEVQGGTVSVPDVQITGAPADSTEKKELIGEKNVPIKREPTVMPLSKRKTKKKEGGGDKNTGGTTTAESNPSAPPSGQAPPQPVNTPVYPSTPPPTTVSVITDIEDSLKGLAQNSGKENVDTKELTDMGKIKRRLNGNLYIKYGGHQCQSVKHLDQPHWYMEIVTDSKVKYKLKSNWEILRKRLIQAKESWESGGVETLYQDLSTRLDYVLENMVEDNFHRGGHHKFVIIDPMTILFSSLRMNDYDLREFSNHELIRLLIGVWSTNVEENKRSGERLLQNRLKKAVALMQQGGKPLEDPKPDQLLDYIPKSLRKLAETFQRRIQEREMEREQIQLQMQRLNNSSEENDMQETEEEEMEGEVTDAVRPPSSTDHQRLDDPHHHNGGLEVPEKRKSHLTPTKTRSPRKTATPMDAKTERSAMKKGKKTGQAVSKTPAVAESVKPTLKRGKNEQDRSTSLKGKGPGGKATSDDKGRASHEEKEEGNLGDETENKEIHQNEESKEDYATECARIRNCAKVGEMIKLYETFFKEPKSIRENLERVILAETHGGQRRDRDSDEHVEPKKLLLSKTGISKYGEKKGENDPEEEDEDASPEKPNKAGLVAQKLLRWAYDYSFLPPTEEFSGWIDDPGELPVFLIRAIAEEKMEQDRLEEARLAALAAEHEGEQE